MKSSAHWIAIASALAIPWSVAVHAAESPATPAVTAADIIRTAPASDWRSPDPENLLYMDIPSGRIVIELAPAFAPRHVINIRALAREGYYDGLAIVRVQDNFVVQWADPDEKNPRPVKTGKSRLPAEFSRDAAGLAFDLLPETDVYAPEVGFVGGFPAARDPAAHRAWLLHCYGMVGAGRDNDADSGGGTELYAVIGHAPRHIDRNVTLVGRVLQGIELLSSLPRGSAEMGFYAQAGERVPIRSVRVAADIDPAQRVNLEVMRTDSESFRRVTEARRNRRDPWTQVMAGHVEVCNVPLPVRVRP